MEFISINFLIIALVICQNYIKPIKKDHETKFNVDLGNGIETVSWSRLNCLTENEKEYLLKNVKQCTQITGSLSNLNAVNTISRCFNS